MGVLGGLSEAEARIAELEQELAAAEQRATRLAALETAARAWRLTDGETDEGAAAVGPLMAAVDALGPPRVAEPCPTCGGELYDQIVRDPATRRPICPHCRADVSATDDDDEDDEDEEAPRAP